MAFEYNVWSNMPSLVPPGPAAAQPLLSRSASPPAGTMAANSLFTLRNGVHSYSVQAVAFGDGKLASTGDNTVVIWSLMDWRPMRTLSGRRGSRYEYVAWDPKQLANRLSTISPNDRSLRIWDLRAKSEQQTEFQANIDTPSGLVWSPDGSSIVIGTSTSLAIYDVRQSRLLATKKFDSYINDFCFVNGFLAVATEKGTVEFVEPHTLSLKEILSAHITDATCVAANLKDEAQLATGGNDSIVQLWRSESPGDFLCQASIDRHISKITSISFSGNGKWVASSSRGEKVIDVSSAETGDLLVTLPNDDPVRMVTFDRSEGDTSILAYCTDNSRDVFIQPIYGTEGPDRVRSS